MKRRVEFEQDERGKWRWREVAANNNIATDSGQGYSRLEHARHAWRRHVEEIRRGDHEEVILDGPSQA